MASRKYSRLIAGEQADNDALLGILSLHSPLGFEVSGADLVACFRDPSSARAARVELAARGHRCELVTDISEGDPLEEFRAASRPFAVGSRLWIDPGDPSDAAAPEGRVALRVPASRAFGTGNHESTRLALLAIEEAVSEPMRVLDAGTGSGILALAAAGLGAECVVAYDADADAVFVARENLRRHAFGGRVRLYAGPTAAIAGRFALVVANMLPDEFLPLRGELLGRLARGGQLVLSGIPAEREEEVLRKFRGPRLRLASRRRENGWASLCLSRASS